MQTRVGKRVAELEREVARLKAERANGRAAPKLHQPGPDDWQKTVGMFRGDLVFQEMIDHAARMREEERDRARRAIEGTDDAQPGPLGLDDSAIRRSSR